MPSPQGWSLDHITNPYDFYSLTARYVWDSGKAASPIAYVQGGLSTETTAKAVNVSKPQGRKVVSFEMRRQGVPCQVPDPLSVSSNEELLSADVVLKDPEIDASGSQYIYHVTGTYTYLLHAPIFINQAQYPLGKVESGQRQGIGDLATDGIDS